MGLLSVFILIFMFAVAKNAIYNEDRDGEKFDSDSLI